jgi:hypothetical protein
MIQVQARISMGETNERGEIAVDILEREDANDKERDIARAIQALHIVAFEKMVDSGMRDSLLTVIDRFGEHVYGQDEEE